MNSLIASNISCLQQGIDFLSALPPELYRKACPGVFGSTIGGHFRHNLDHYEAFLLGAPNGEVDYDARPRSARTESNPEEAIRLLQNSLDSLNQLDGMDLDQSMKIRMDDGGDSSWSRTTARRELQFLLSHTIHHYALIVSISTINGFNSFPSDFGVAPSTIHYQQDQETG